MNLSRLLSFRHSAVALYCLLYASICLLLRMALALRCWNGASHDLSFLATFPIGFTFDLFMGLVFALPFSLALGCAPAWWMRSRAGRMGTHLFFVGSLTAFLFGAASEWIFWGEFECRFNFIAVDYLVYTQEVIANITQSYPVPWILLALALAVAGIYTGFIKLGWMKRWQDAPDCLDASWRQRLIGTAITTGPVFLGLLLALGAGRTEAKGAKASEALVAGLRQMESLCPSFANNYNKELAKNGAFSFVGAFFSNKLEYARFYPCLGDRSDSKTPPAEAFAHLRPLLAQDNATFTSADPTDITRHIRADGPAKRLNVIQITVESLSYEFMGRYDFGASEYPAKRLTPHLDALSRESLFFNRMYAGGTRTVRGMEALSLSVPPTPGQSVLRRAHNENLFSLPGVFHQAGYDCAFIYGGAGYFDNMNYFFEHNGCRIVDRPVKEAQGTKPTFANAWGVCDEDLFDWVLEEADKAHAAKTPFYHFVMTTSNHRPFTWPGGKTQHPCGTVEGAVEYTDLAIHNLIEKSRTKPWFNDTVFVIVADHDMKVAGKQELVVKKYEIPLMMYCPAHIQPRQIDSLCSQIDYAPTLLGLLNWSYDSKFFGRDVLRATPARPRAFISNYQKVGMISEASGTDQLAVMMPVRRTKLFQADLKSGDLALRSDLSTLATDPVGLDAAAYYQSAAWLLDHQRYGMSTAAPAKP